MCISDKTEICYFVHTVFILLLNIHTAMLELQLDVKNKLYPTL